jgi:hypothetical protein
VRYEVFIIAMKIACIVKVSRDFHLNSNRKSGASGIKC